MALPARVALAAVALLAVGLASAHGTTIAHDLAGVRLCVDDDSLAVSIERDPGGRVALLVRERIDRAVAATFDAAELPWQRTSACPAGRGYVEIALHIRDASSFAPRASEYDAVVRVGWRMSGEGGVRADPPDAFDFAVRDLFDEAAVAVPAFVFLPRYVEAGLRDLSVSWWEDREAVQEALVWWLPGLGALLGVLTGGASYALARRRRSRRRCSATASEATRAYHRVCRSASSP